MAEQGYRPIPTANDLVARKKEQMAAATSQPEAGGIAPQASWNRFARGEQLDSVVTPLGTRGGQVGTVAIEGNVQAPERPDLEHPGADDQRRWDAFARMPGDAGADIHADRAVGFGESTSQGSLERPASGSNVVQFPPRQPQ
jgi:hypothetical protein